MKKTAIQLVYDLVKSGLTAKEIVNALLADEKLLLEKEKEIIVEFTLKHSDDKVDERHIRKEAIYL